MGLSIDMRAYNTTKMRADHPDKSELIDEILEAIGLDLFTQDDRPILINNEYVDDWTSNPDAVFYELLKKIGIPDPMIYEEYLGECYVDGHEIYAKLGFDISEEVEPE